MGLRPGQKLPPVTPPHRVERGNFPTPFYPSISGDVPLFIPELCRAVSEVGVPKMLDALRNVLVARALGQNAIENGDKH